jgi:virginiamycin B lyase
MVACLLAPLVLVGLTLTALPASAAPTFTTVALPAGATPIGVAVGPGGVWYTDPGRGEVGVIGAGDVVTAYPLNEGDGAPTAIGAGPDGAVWFTEPGTNQLGRVTTDGSITDVFVGDGANPSGVAAGPDGNLWYALRAVHRVGWGTIAGFQEITLPNQPGPSSIAAGPDGGIWYTGQRSGVIGRVDVATKQVTTHLLPNATSQPNSIVAGADGALWFTLRTSNQLGRITTGGAVTLFDLPSAGANANGIAAAPDGALWFAETALDRVARFVPGEGFQEFAVGGSPRAVAVDAAGDAWVSEATPGTVTRIDLVSTPVDTTPPTITIDAPAPGAWTVQDSDPLDAVFGCDDETELASCDGDVVSGDPVDDDTLGARTFSVHAEDVAGNEADASVGYLVFASADGTLFDGTDVRPGGWVTLSLGMALPKHAPDPLAGATSQAVDCATGEAQGAHEPAVVRSRVAPTGSLELRWDTDRSASGCRTLWLSFSAAGWAGPEGAFGPVHFSGGPVGKQRP